MRGLKHQKEKRSMDHFAGLDVPIATMRACRPQSSIKLKPIVLQTFAHLALHLDEITPVQ